MPTKPENVKLILQRSKPLFFLYLFDIMRYTFRLQTMKADSRNVKNGEIYENILFFYLDFLSPTS